MYEVEASIEVYESVFYEDDGMRTYDVTKAPVGWHIVDGKYYSDGEYGTLECTYLTNSKYSCGIDKSVGFDSSSYKYVYVKCNSLTADNLRICAYSISTSMIESTMTTSGIGTLDMTGYGGTVSKIKLYAYGDENEKAIVDYIVICDDTMSNIFPSALEINRRVTEGFDDAVFTYDYEYTFPLLNSHVKIWLNKDTISNYKKVFCGKTRKNREIKDGKVPKWHETEADGYGKYLYERKYVRGIIDNVDNVINSITTDLRNDGLITTYNVTSSGTEIKIRNEEGGRIVGDILEQDVCSPEKNRIDWDFYVDFGKDLHAYPKGSKIQNTNVGTHAITFNYEKDTERMINTIRIFGDAGRIYGSDTDWTEEITNWSGNVDVGQSVIYVGKGAHSIRGYGDSSGIWLERTISPSLDLRGGGYLKFLLAYAMLTTTERNTLDMSAYFYTDDSNYYLYSWKESGGKHSRYISIVELENYPGFFSDGIEPKEIPITGITSNKDFTEVGHPNWGDISKIRIEINEPLSDAGKDGHIWIDGMSIETRYWGIYGDSVSISSFGVRETPDQIRPNLTSDAACTLAASLVVEAYKDPLENITNVTASKEFDGSIGYRVGFTVGDVDTSLDLRRITHNLDDFELTTDLELSNRYLPDVDKMLGEFQRDLEQLDYKIEAWKNIFGVSAIQRERAGLIDWWHVDSDFGVFSFSGNRVASVLGESGDGYVKVTNEDGAYDFGYGRIQLSSGAISGGYSRITPASGEENFHLKHSKFYSVVKWSSTVSIISDVGAGNPYTGSYYGFSLRDNILWAMNRSVMIGQSSINIGSITPDSIYILEAEFIPDDDICRYWVNGTFETSITTNTPGSDFWIMCGAVETGDTNDKTLNIYSYQVAYE